jgi:hypothetical protein
MCYSGIYIKPNSTTQDFQKIVDSYYDGVLWTRNMEEEMRIQNEKYRQEYEERLIESNGTSGIGCSVAGCSVTLKSYISHMVSQAYYVSEQCPSNWIAMWRKKFKDEPEILLAFDYHKPISKIELLRKERKEKINVLQSKL